MAQNKLFKQESISVLDALYCSEEHLEEEVVVVDISQELEEVVVEESYCSINEYIKPSPPILLDQDLVWEDDELISLLAKEKQNEQCNNTLQTNRSLLESRGEAVEWILKVVAHYSFSALTAVLAVDYLDRFLLTSFHVQTEKPWMTQLAAVTCLSLAAKVEEIHVPLLLDFQVEESKYLFEAKTIKRMELLVLSTLQWKMNPVTPISFLDFIIRRLGLKDHLCWEFLKRCESIVLSVITDSRFKSFLPSIMATATMLHVVSSIEPCLQVEYQKQLLGILRIDKDKAEDCCKFILELAPPICRGNQSNKRKFGLIPGSPSGVMDVLFSSDSSNDSWASASSVSSPETLSKKKIRAQQDQLNAD
ncbi:cyclin-D3-3-like [Humulus lupulus]|uniref:cyclin-D3-3-like n=1 Tax=Humulus lupulus TaxID=3486 RepID=UPI002B4067A5|nr:cyclin-D3-3-like [Humulus lupulus]